MTAAFRALSDKMSVEPNIKRALPPETHRAIDKKCRIGAQREGKKRSTAV